MMNEYDAACAGWYYDPLHQQPVYLFWDYASWRARFVWQDPHTEAPLSSGGGVTATDEPLTRDMYQRLVPLGEADAKGDASVRGHAIRQLYDMRHLVQVKPEVGGRGVFIQAPAVEDRGQCDALCQAVWLSVDEIPTIPGVASTPARGSGGGVGWRGSAEREQPMSDGSRPGSQLWREFHDFERRYELAKDQLSADDMLALWSALWRFAKHVSVDQRRLKVVERKRQRAR
jgi:hypothetical protein